MRMRERYRKRDKRGREAGVEGREGRRDLEEWSLTSFPGLQPAFIPAGTKTASPALPALPLNPHQHALYHSHTHGKEQHTHMCRLLHLWGKKKKSGAGGDGGGRWSISDQLSALLLSSGKNSNMPAFYFFITFWLRQWCPNCSFGCKVSCNPPPPQKYTV